MLSASIENRDDEIERAFDARVGRDESSSCPSTGLHMTAWAYRRHGCRCPGAASISTGPAVKARVPLPRGRRGVDQAAVDRVIAGEYDLPLGLQERRLVIAAWKYEPAAEIARRLGICERTVTRHRAALRRRGAPLA